MAKLFSDRNSPPTPRTATVMDVRTKKAIASLIDAQFSSFALGHSFPDECPDGGAQFGMDIGMDKGQAENILRGVVPAMKHLQDYTAYPEEELQEREDAAQGSDSPDESTISTFDFLDALEWCAGHVGKPTKIDFHTYFRHHNMEWDRAKGLHLFRGEVNQILARNGLAYEMNEDGLIHRTAEGPPAEALKGADFETGDTKTNEFLEDARTYYFDRSPKAGQLAVTTIWAAFERIKTHKIPGKDNCSIPDDHIDPRRAAFFMAKWVLGDVRKGGEAC